MPPLARRLLTRLAAVVTALGLISAGALLLVQPAYAAASKITVGAVKTGNGTLTTPRVTDHGRATITKTSYRITRSGKTVATTSKPGTKVKVRAGKYKVKTVVRYRVGSAKKTYTKTRSVTVKTNSPIMTRAEYNRITKGMTRSQVRTIVGSAGKVWECAPDGSCAVFFRSTGHKRIVVLTFRSNRVTAKNGYPGDRMDAYYDALFG